MQSSNERGPRSHNIKNHNLFRELTPELVHMVYEFLDELWNLTAFIPMPIPVVVNQFKSYNVTATHAMLIILRWHESRLKGQIYQCKPED
jgi:hypothetical protein